MRRSNAPRLILACTPLLVVAVAATAAPAPVFRPNPATPWVTGWDRPVDPLGDCRFIRAGDKLTIRVPSMGHGFRDEVPLTTAPHLLREIEGDFDVQVRVGGDFDYAAGSKGNESRAAGIVIADGTNFLRFGRSCVTSQRLMLRVQFPNRSGATERDEAGCFLKPTQLRVERRKNVLTVKYRIDQPKWTVPFEGHPPWVVRLPSRVKVGVFAESMAPGSFEPLFDHFELTRVK